MFKQFIFLKLFLLAGIVPALVAAAQESPDDVIAVRDKLNRALGAVENSEDKDTIKTRLSTLADIWLFSSDILPEDKLCETYTVKSGDTLSKIGQRYKVPYEILLEINKIKDAKSLQAGRKIKVINGPFNAKINRSTFTLDLYLQKTFVRSFPVCIGKQDTPTPTGLWRVEPKGKMIKPPWYDEHENKT
ncbi:LysM peptidoglycan-binding domain-containing protein, partial [Planctomycetota bacterium]